MRRRDERERTAVQGRFRPINQMGESLGRLQSHEKQFTSLINSGQVVSAIPIRRLASAAPKRPLPPIGLVRTVRGRVDRRRRAHPRRIRGARGAGGPAIEAKAVRRLSANFAWARGRTGGCPAVERERHRQFLSMMSWMSDKAIIGHSCESTGAAVWPAGPRRKRRRAVAFRHAAPP